MEKDKKIKEIWQHDKKDVDNLIKNTERVTRLFSENGGAGEFFDAIVALRLHLDFMKRKALRKGDTGS